MAADRRGWRPGGLANLAGLAGVLLLLVGLATGRPDVALLGVPGLLATLISRTGRTPDVLTAEPEAGPLEVVGGITSGVRVSGGEVAHVRASAPGHRKSEFVARVPEMGRTFELKLASRRTGPQATALADVRGYAGAWQHEPLTVGGSTRLVLPTATPLGRVPVPRRLRGLAGPRVSRRFGDGSELRDVHPFQPGDRLKRIDWRATARRSPNLDTLYVRRTFADAEAAVMLVVDSRDDVGPDVRTWSGFGERRVDEATSLDLARGAAASVAQTLVDRGDRVGLVDLGRNARPLAPAAGGRQLRRVLHGLALARPVGTPSRRVRPPQVPADAMIYLFSTMLDEPAADLVRTWRSLGHPVVVVDTLPDVHAVTQTSLAIAWRIVSMERQLRLDELTREHIPVVAWAAANRTEAIATLAALGRAAARQRDWR